MAFSGGHQANNVCDYNNLFVRRMQTFLSIFCRTRPAGSKNGDILLWMRPAGKGCVRASLTAIRGQNFLLTKSPRFDTLAPNL
jgi:hypothetical protein